MVWQALQRLAERAPQVLELIKEAPEDLEAWQEHKIALANEYVDLVYDSLKFSTDGGVEKPKEQSKVARAAVNPVRQRSQYSCMAASMAMCLRSFGVPCDEDEVNRVMGAKPLRGAAWENALACGQHYGMRCTLMTPCTISQLKSWTDEEIPVMIAWNPEGRPWSHASVVFDVDDDHTVYVADPNMPDPNETVRVVPKKDFYAKWYESFPDYLVRRPALAVEREITSDGRQTKASVADPVSAAYERYVQAVANLESGADLVLVAANKLRSLGLETVDEYYPFSKSIERVATDIYRWRGEVERRASTGDLPRVAHRVARRHLSFGGNSR